ncbi:hypothetical protein CgunFtcFv8_021583 [Champsocephalus gunnari]|nr:hypothetical protein CgunFtcFv8_021583 [Champsocephalus gunnari]
MMASPIAPLNPDSTPSSAQQRHIGTPGGVSGAMCLQLIFMTWEVHVRTEDTMAALPGDYKELCALSMRAHCGQRKTKVQVRQ